MKMTNLITDLAAEMAKPRLTPPFETFHAWSDKHGRNVGGFVETERDLGLSKKVF